VEIMECSLCGTPETQRPLLAARFDCREVRFCPGCLPQLIHGLAPEDMAAELRQKGARS